ncbi:MAG: hypothetical protein ACFFCW_00485 [Candidatus Hodarchaeota archaeon]
MVESFLRILQSESIVPFLVVFLVSISIIIVASLSKAKANPLWILQKKFLISDFFYCFIYPRIRRKHEIPKKKRNLERAIEAESPDMKTRLKKPKINGDLSFGWGPEVEDEIRKGNLFWMRINQLEKRIENLEKKTLSKWDVAIVVGTIIAGITFVVGVTCAIIKYVGKTP